MTERLIVIGGDAAGMSAATNARRLRGPEELEIVAFERGAYTSYSACGIPYFVGDTVHELDDLVVRSPEEFRSRNDIDARIHHEVVAIDLDARKVTVRDLEASREHQDAFDSLMIGTGAIPIVPEWPNSDAEGIFGVQILEQGEAVRRYVEERSPRNAVVVGGGYIGIEMAEALLQRGLHVALVEADEQPMRTLDPDMGSFIAERMRDIGIELFTDEEVSGFESDGDRVTAVVTARRTLEADIVVMGLGVRPDVTLAEDAGITIGSSGAIAVDRRMHTSAEGVWAGGDCAEKFHLVGHHHVHLPLGTHANKEGRVAGINIGGGYETFPGVLGTAASKVCDVEVARTGLTEREATTAGFDHLSVTTDSTTRAGYFPGTEPIKTKIVVERGTGRILGAQIVGRAGAAKRIDVFAAALWNDMTVEDMLNMDLSYAPPFSPVWDAVLIAARRAWQKVESS